MSDTRIDAGKRTQCACCDRDLLWRWCDLHGVAACDHCGLPYRIYHYEGEGDERKRVDLPPSLMLTEKAVGLAREYWNDRRKRVFPAAYDMGFTERDGRSFSGATLEEAREFFEWLKVRDPQDETAEPRP